MLAYALTVFLGAFLLFQVQPIIGKFLLPWFGGAPAVWTTCMLFFQLLLLGGYLYAHAIVRHSTPRGARTLHTALLVSALLLMLLLAVLGGSPLLPPAAWKPVRGDAPVITIFLLLCASVGLCYFLLSTTGPLMQAWAARSHPRTRVYRLYALSNAASLLALISYPPLVERLFSVKTQAIFWCVGFVAFAVGSAFCAWRAARGPSAECEVPSSQLSAPVSNSALRTSNSELLFWFALAACGSAMLLATTNQMCQEVAAIPFLWILPLCLYLLSFVLCFENERFYRRWLVGPFLAVGLGWAGLVLFRGFTVPIRTQVAAYSVALFAACLVCHGELARSKPSPERLTSFYLTVAAGGAAGGLFVALIAPWIFRGFWEIHVTLFLAGFLAIVALIRDRGSWFYTRRPWPAFLVLLAAAALAWHVRDPDSLSSAGSTLHAALGSGRGRLALGAAAAALLLLLRRRSFLWVRGSPWLTGTCLAGALGFFGLVLASEVRQFLESAVTVSRNFYGVLTIERLEATDPERDRLSLRHGRIVHGFQYRAADKRDLPTTYYAETSGIGVVLLHHPHRTAGPLRVGGVGLGVGTLAAYGRPGDTFTFYEINPAVVRLSAGRESVFRYVRDSRATVDVRLGDARLSLERELALGGSRRFDVLAVDAFSSDSIPVHLLTREAVQLYLSHLGPDGILALHVSNRHLNLAPVVRALAESEGVEASQVDRSAAGEAVWASTWVLLARDGSVLDTAEIDEASEALPDKPVVRVWTDDYSNLFDALK